MLFVGASMINMSFLVKQLVERADIIMNKTKIDWVDMTWNPITGCRYGCRYCYARKIAERFAPRMSNGEIAVSAQCELVRGKSVAFPYGFTPTLYEKRLDEPAKIKKSQNIFVCSMADLFGDWIPDEWIDRVLSVCEQNPQHNYLFLTKNPTRYPEGYQSDPQPKNLWFGSTITTHDDDYTANKSVTHPCANYFVSIEPIHGDIFKNRIDELFFRRLNWVIVGAETGNDPHKIVPKKEWIDKIVRNCREANIPLFMKESLKDLMGDEFVQELPDGLRH